MSHLMHCNNAPWLHVVLIIDDFGNERMTLAYIPCCDYYAV